MNWLERAIATVAPGAALNRARSRAVLDILQSPSPARNGHKRLFDAAKTGNRTDGWVSASAGTSADAEILPALSKIRDRSRDLARNNPYAVKALNVLTANVVGTGIRPEVKTGSKREQANKEAVWGAWCDVADADEDLDFYGIQRLVLRTVVESGECLVRIRPRFANDGLPVPMQLQVLEPDFIDSSVNYVKEGRFALYGIEYDTLGRRTGYYLFERHPGSNSPMMLPGLKSNFVPASDVIRIFDKVRPGQTRGVPWFAPSALDLWDLSSYAEAELVRKRVEACLTAFVTQDADPTARPIGPAGTSSTADRRVETLEPGIISYMKPGEEITFNAPQGTGGYAEYMSVSLHAIAAGTGVTYEQMTGDLSGVNYSSYRAGHLEFRAMAELWRAGMIVHQLSKPVYRRFCELGAVAGRFRDPVPYAEWISPPWQSIDPEKEANADLLELRLGGMTLRTYLTKKGIDYADWCDEMAEQMADLDRLGIRLDSDVRYMARNGAALASPAALTDETGAGNDNAADA